MTLRRAATAALLLAALYASGILVAGPSTTGQWISNLGLIAAALLGGSACFWRARRGETAAWVLIGAGALSWGVGQVAWTFYESVQGREVPFPSAADAGYLLAPVLLVTGLLRLPSGAAGMAGRVRLLLDGLLVGLSLLMLSWQVVLQATVEASAGDLVTDLISIAYPVADVVVGTVAVIALLRARHGGGVRVLALGLLLLGTVGSAVADSGFAFLALRGTYFSGHPIDIAWCVGWLTLGVAACVPGGRAETAEDAGGRTVGLLAPYVAVGVAVVVDVTKEVTVGRLGPTLAWGTIALVVLLSVRQVLVLHDYGRLTRTLEGRVRERTEALAGRELWFRTLVQNLNDVVTVVDEVGIVTYQTPSAELHFGHRPDELVGHSLLQWWDSLDAARLSRVLEELHHEPGATRRFAGDVLHADGSRVPVEVTVTAVANGEAFQGFVLNARDVSEQRTLEKELSHQAFHDALTGLANRALFHDRVDHALRTRARTGQPLAVLFLDLDGFKGVNDTLGHGIGDELLVEVAAVLLRCVRPGDTVARLGGDEFALLLEDLASDGDAADVAVRVREALLEPLEVSGQRIQARASCGIALYTGAEDADVLLRNADLAMYRAKERGLGGFELYEVNMHEGLVTQMELESDLREALLRGQLRVVYQPTMSLKDKGWHSCEALLRWDHPTRGLVPPNEFIPIAERTGLIVQIGAWVLAEACRQTMDWRADHLSAADLGIAVNVSTRQLHDPAFLATVDEALNASRLPASALTLELTESILVEHTEDVLALLGALKARGVRLAIDDFGTGYSSLSYLHRFPIDVLKVDRSFIGTLGTGDDELTKTIVRLGQSLGLTTVAEGIEERDQLAALRGMGCDLGQGFLLARPERPEVVEALFAEGYSNAEA